MRISDWSSDVCSSDLGGRLAGADALADRGDGVADHVAVDFPKQAVFLGDLQEAQRLDQLAVAGVQSQEGLVDRARVALQAYHRLVLQHETLACERLPQPRDPRPPPLFPGPPDRARAE